MEQKTIDRRSFVKGVTAFSALSMLSLQTYASLKSTRMRMGLVTYLWGKDWDVPTLIKNCNAASIGGEELRVDHAHGVEPTLSAAKRSEVKKKFNDSPVQIVGMGTNQQYDFVEPEKLKASIDKTIEFIKLSHDIGGSGVKVKPNAFHEGVPHEKTLEQIGRALDTVGKVASDYGQKIRLEVHGEGTQELPNIKTMMDFVDSKAVGVCWNCNDEDLLGEGLVSNFNLVKNRLGDTVHVRELNIGTYPYQELMKLFVDMNYDGWILLECRTDPADKVKAMIEQREVWKKMVKGK